MYELILYFMINYEKYIFLSSVTCIVTINNYYSTNLVTNNCVS